MTEDSPIATGPDPGQSWITRREAAQLLRVSPSTFDRYRRQGKVTRYRTPGAHPRFRRAEVLALLAESPPREAAG